MTDLELAKAVEHIQKTHGWSNAQCGRMSGLSHTGWADVIRFWPPHKVLQPETREKMRRFVEANSGSQRHAPVEAPRAPEESRPITLTPIVTPSCARMRELLTLYATWDAAGQMSGIRTWIDAMIATGMVAAGERAWLIRTHGIAMAAREHSVTPTSLLTPMASAGLPAEGLDLAAASWEFEGRLLLQALKRTSGNKNRAANLLRMNRTTFVEKVRMHVRRGDRALAPYFAG